MPAGALVAIPELQSEGVARLLGEKGTTSLIRFLASGAEKTQEGRQVSRYVLLPGSRVMLTSAAATAPRPATISALGLQRDAASGLLVYGVTYTDTQGGEARIREDAIVSVTIPLTAMEQLCQAAYHDLRPAHDIRLPGEPWGGPIFCAREELLAWRDAAWSGTGGVIALAGARVRPLPHQLVTARRVLSDRQIRFLLADEVGLGKTIEAGLILQSLLAMQPRLRVLVVVPGALVSQWFLELFVKFGGRPFLMLDRERLETYPGNPWKDEQFLISSNRALEELDNVNALRLAQSHWDLLIVDECHRMQPQGILYKRIATISRKAPHVLLLSATPARQHADAYLALLALLQPQVYQAEDRKGFAAKLKAHAKVVELLGRTKEAALSALPALSQEWRALLGADPLLVRRASDLAEEPIESTRSALIAHVVENHQLDSRIIRHRRQVLARLSQATGVGGLSLATRTVERLVYAADKPELAVRGAMAAYRQALMAPYPDPAQAPPRLVHWLLQVQMAMDSHPRVLDRLLSMRATVLDDPEQFAAYRARVIKGESLTQVLRGDLSESEVISHITSSAACNCDNPLEVPALKALHREATSWSRKAPARDRTLVTRLERFWKEHPQEKVLIFTSHSLTLAPLAEFLTEEFGEKAIETFGAHQDTVAREESARRFKDDDRCHVMVSDPLGGEGRNFQFVSVVVHHDLPWSVAAVEQRIGRVDRIGRDGEVPSWVLVADGDDAIDAQWADVLEHAVGVFSGPSSGLEFITDEIETQALAALLGGGAKAMGERLESLTALVATERSRSDDREEELFQQETKVYAEAAALAVALEQATAPAEAVIRWLRGMGGSARRDDETPKLFHLRTRYNDKPDHGTFDRALALSQPHLSFFAVGHGLVDRALDDAASASWCSAQAWRRKAGKNCASWEGVRASFALEYDLSTLTEAGLRLESLRRLFILAPPVRVTICARIDGSIESDAKVLLALAAPFDHRQGDLPLSQNGSRDIWARLMATGAVAQVTKWQADARRACEAASAQAERMLATLRDPVVATLAASFANTIAISQAQASTAAASLGAGHAETLRASGEALDEERQAGALQAAVAGARLRLSTAAYIVVA
jgi:ATP-dependent helicase HepA